MVGAPEGVGSLEGEGSPEGEWSLVGVGSPERMGSLGSSGSWTPLPSQLPKCETEMREENNKA